MVATRPSILVVEPNSRERSRLGRGLRRLGHRVKCVGTAPEAIACVFEPGSAVVAILSAGLVRPDLLDRIRGGIKTSGSQLTGVILTVERFSSLPAPTLALPEVLDVVSKGCPLSELDTRLRLTQARLERSQSTPLGMLTGQWQLQALFDAIPFPLYIKNPRHRFEVVNRAYLEFFGVTRAWLTGRVFGDIPGRSKTEIARVQQAEEQVLAAGTAVMAGDLAEHDGQGRRRAFWKIVLPMRDDEDRIIGLMGLMEDVTGRRQTTERLRESEATLRQAQRIAHIANWTWDIVRNEVTWCEEIHHIFGFDPALTKPSMEALIAAVHPNDRSAVRIARERAVAERRAYESDHRIVLPGGGERHVHEQGQVYRDGDGQPTRMLGVVMDVTERMAVEQERARLVTAVEQAGDAIIITDTEGNIQYVNQAFERITGFTVDEVRGRQPSILKSGLQDSQFYAGLWDALRRGRVWQGRYINRRKDGTTYHSHATIAPVTNEKGETTNFVSVQRDISAVLRMEEQLQRAQRIEAIATLTAGIAHDFNNILTPIIGFTQLTIGLLEPGSRARENLQMVRAAADRAKRLVAQIRQFSQEREQELAIVEVPALCREVLALIRSTVPKSIEIVEEIDQGVRPVYGDASLLHGALTNLCVNACQSMPKGGTLLLSVAQVELTEPSAYLGEPTPGSYVSIRVLDTGSGIDEATKARLFEPYFTTKAAGTGLGLYSAYGTVRRHSGGIRVQSQPGMGTTFEVILPVSDLPLNGVPKALGILPPGSERILVVDDEESIVRLTRAALAPLGYHVTAFTDPRAALSRFKAAPDAFDIVITDLAMPHLSGDVLAAEVHKLGPSLPILLLTGMCDPETEAELRAKGVNRIVRKPFDPAELPSQVRALLDSRKALHANAAKHPQTT